MKIWAVCLYFEGGPQDGKYQMEFVRATDSDDAEAQAINLNEGAAEGFTTICVAEMPEGL